MSPYPNTIELEVTHFTINKAVADIGGLTSAGLQVSPTEWSFDTMGAPGGIPVSIRIVGVATGGVPEVEISGGMDATKATCRDKTNRQRAIGDIIGPDPEDCVCTGMTPSAGDKLVILVTGEIVGGGGDQPF